jgi:hypothetical protein
MPFVLVDRTLEVPNDGPEESTSVVLHAAVATMIAANMADV